MAILLGNIRQLQAQNTFFRPTHFAFSPHSQNGALPLKRKAILKKKSTLPVKIP